jgi:hypothetical protein
MPVAPGLVNGEAYSTRPLFDPKTQVAGLYFYFFLALSAGKGKKKKKKKKVVSRHVVRMACLRC